MPYQYGVAITQVDNDARNQSIHTILISYNETSDYNHSCFILEISSLSLSPLLSGSYTE